MNNENFEKQGKQEELTDLLRKLEINEWSVDDEVWENQHPFSAPALFQSETNGNKLIQKIGPVKPGQYEQIKTKVAQISYFKMIWAN